ncbi:MAG: N-acetyltransferase [Gammaproteobacteria bacterium]|nr:N-acetyltransferase [Gammaproteobacteria bacterium]
MEIKILSSFSEVNCQQWNALLIENNPFVRYEFLNALEVNACADAKFGWIPRHIAIFENNELIAACLLYEKHNTYGEFVFDHAWSEAYQRNGLAYFPKLVSCIPFNPIQGQRFLCAPGREGELFPSLLNTIQEIAQKYQYSSFHCLFSSDVEQDWFQEQGLLSRHDCQFHWFNDKYQSFDDFLSKLSSRKRKNIRKERERVKQAGVTFRILNGSTATDKDWQDFTRFYLKTFEDKWGMATLNENFFKQVARDLPEQIVLVLADKGDKCIAGALMYRSDTNLYGRFWGCDTEVEYLHFEACYYQGIDYCIEHGLKKFEPGAQGEHKIARGFVPTLTRSSHWLSAPYFQQAILQFTEHEKSAVKNYMDNLHQHLPYKSAKS